MMLPLIASLVVVLLVSPAVVSTANRQRAGVHGLSRGAADVRQFMPYQQIDHREYRACIGEDISQITNWRWLLA